MFLGFIGSRLDLGIDVAYYKFTHNVPVYAIRIVEREQQIIKEMTDYAKELGIDPEWTRTFFRNQMFANNMVQTYYFKQWSNGTKYPDRIFNKDIPQLRNKIDVLNRDLMFRAKTSLEFRKKDICPDVAKNATIFIERFFNFDPELTRLYRTYAISNICLNQTQTST